MGVRLVRNFFLTWSPSVRTKTPWQTKKTNGTPLWSYKYFFISLESKIWLSSHFRVQNTFFIAFSRGVWEGPQVSEISSSNKSGKIYLCEGRTQILVTFDPLNPRFWLQLGKSFSKQLLATRESRILGGQKCCRFFGAPRVEMAEKWELFIEKSWESDF